jgi:hypothetical protein
MANEWLDRLFGNKIEKEAMESQGTDAQNHFERKVEAHPWVNDILSLDPVQVEAEYKAKLQEEAMRLGKTAALDDVIADGVTPEETVNRDYKRDVTSLSDYALAELLAEARGHKAQNTNEMYYELKEKAKAEVASSREKAEKALLELIPDNAQLDWQKAFKEYTKDAPPAEPKDKDLFKSDVPEKAHDFQHPTEEKFKLPRDPEKAIPGNGREADERKEVTQEAGVLKADIVEGTSKEASLDKKADQPMDENVIREAFKQMVNGAGEEIILDLLMQFMPTDAMQNMLDELSDEGTFSPSVEHYEHAGVPMAIAKLRSHVLSKKASCPICGSEGKDLNNKETDHLSCQSCGITYGEPEIKSCASKKEVIEKIAELKKTAEVSSPWQVVVDEKTGQEVIARVDEPTNVKESEEVKVNDLQK